ncbi:MAG: hypothetical protein U5Q16_13590 [Gammaproteobacteria bacterium]|nr:hypothetical protein [Gammaproteobacteria bacterium]
MLVAQRQGRVGDDPLRFELAKGSFAFQQGMYRTAARTFEAVDQAELTDLDRMRLAFHLAREHYRRGRWSAMEERLAEVDLGATWLGRQRRHPEVTFMRAEGALAREDFAAAGQLLAELPPRDTYRAYGLFNLGVAQRQAGDAAASQDTFRTLADLQAHDAESWDLVQRGRLALAMTAARTGADVDVRSVLGTLPAAGRYRDMALAGYGKLAMQRAEHELAARIWLTLLEQDGWSEGHAVARLGLPMSLERLASPAHALQRYRDAEQAFEARLTALQDVSSRARDPLWVDALLEVFAEPDETARSRALGRLDERLGEQSWLSWLAGEDVHQVMVEWRELNAMAAWLERLPARVDAYAGVTREQRRRSAAARELLEEEALPDRRDALGRRVAELESTLAELRSQPARMEPAWLLRLADESERELITELADMAELAARHMPQDERPQFEARLRRLMGVVFWQVADERSARVRTLHKSLDENRALLAAVDARIARLAEAESRFAAGVESDFLLLAERADQVGERVAAALDSRREVLADALQRGLREDMARTERYLLTARIAVARATDQLAAAGDGQAGGS